MTKSENTREGWRFPEASTTDEIVSFERGDLEIFLRRNGIEVQLADRPAESDKELEWGRWTTRSEDAEIEIQPRLPAYPILCEPASKFSVLPGARARVFIEIPLSVAVLATPTLLAEYQTEVLSHTWFGELHTGELCYWMSTAAHLKPPAATSLNRAIAPVVIENKSTENLEINRICLRTFGLPLYSLDGQIWTSDTEIRYVGGFDASKVKIKTGAPDEAKLATLVSPARETNVSSLVARTFRSLREWTSIDLNSD